MPQWSAGHTVKPDRSQKGGDGVNHRVKGPGRRAEKLAGTNFGVPVTEPPGQTDRNA